MFEKESYNLETTETVDSIGNVKNKNIFSYTIASDFILIIPGAICSIISALGTPVQTIVYGIIFSKMSDFYIGKYSDSHKFIKDVSLYCFILIIAGAAKSIGSTFMCYFWITNGEVQQKRIRKLIFNKLLVESSIGWIENFKNVNGEITQLNRCVEEFRTCNAEVIAMFIQSFVSSISLFVIAMKFSWSVTLVVLALTPLFVISSWLNGKVVYKAANMENSYTAQSSKILNWVLSKPELIRLFNAKDVEVTNFTSLVDKCSKFNYIVQNATNLNVGFLKALSILMFVQGFWFGDSMIRLGNLKINQVFTTFSACIMMAESVSIVTEVIGEFYRGQAAVGKIQQFLSLPSNNGVRRGTISPTWCNGEIEFQDVQFKYDNRSELILKNINLKLRSNEMNFIIGKSGSGKSTLAQFIMKFYEPNCGKVLIDGHDINSLDPNWICNNVTLISSNTVIFNQSLKDNISLSVSNQYGDNVPEPLVQEAISFALLDDLLAKSDMNNSISNSKLSGGEKQRIAIARARLRDTPILILDEGLSALDDNNRENLYHAIKTWRLGKTTVFITHELDYIQSEDFVIIMEDGRIKDQGPMREFPLIKDFNIKLENNHKSAGSEISEVTLIGSEDKESGTTDLNPDKDIYGILKIISYCFKRSSKLYITLGMVFAVVYGVSSPLFSYLFSRLLNNMVDTSIGNNNTELKMWSGIIIGVAFISGGSYYLSNFLLAVSGEKCVNHLRKLSLKKLNDQDLTFFHNENHRISELNALLMNDTRDLRNMISKFFSVAITLIILVSVGIILALIFGWKLTLVGLAFVALIFLSTIAYSGIMQRRETSYKDKVNDLEAINFDMINGIKTIRSFNLAQYFTTQFDDKVELMYVAGRSRALTVGISHGLNQLAVSIATGFIMYYGMVLLGNDEYTKLQFLQVMTLLIMTFGTASTLIGELPDLTRGQRSGTYIMKLLNLSSSVGETSGTERPLNLGFTSIDGSSNGEAKTCELIKFSNVSFTYNGPTILNNMNFTINENSIFGIIGQSGSGKSTITNLITKLYGEYSGSITLDDTEISSLNTQWLRQYISVVPQTPAFFEGTLYDNLTYGLPKETCNSNIDQYLKLANIYSFVNSLSEGLQTTIGSLTENSLVSTGQLQRLAIVRAIIRQPQVLILDECTSNLDPENFKIIKDLIVKLNRLGITIILISHSTELLGITTDSIQLSRGVLN